jgi:aminopeptidase N
MFDQPNLKASYHLIVAAPSEWTVISNNILERKDPANLHNEEYFGEQEGDYTVWNFGKSEVYSTYLFCICAGTFEEIKCE